MWSFSWPLPTGPFLSWAEDPRTGCSTPGDVSEGQRIRAQSRPLTCWPHCFWCSAQDAAGFLGCVPTMAGSCSVFYLLMTPSHPWQGCSQPLHAPACIDTRACPDPGAGPLLALGLAEPHEAHTGLLLDTENPTRELRSCTPVKVNFFVWKAAETKHLCITTCLTVTTDLIITFPSQINS